MRIGTGNRPQHYGINGIQAREKCELVRVTSHSTMVSMVFKCARNANMIRIKQATSQGYQWQFDLRKVKLVHIY